MKKVLSLLIPALILCGSCTSYEQVGGTVAGSSLGGMLGSSIGGLSGGYRGHARGTIAGMVLGGAVGAIATAPLSERPQRQHGTTDGDYRSERNDVGEQDEVRYGTYNVPDLPSPVAARSDLEFIEVTNIHFLDENNNRALDRDEQAYLVMDIYNRGDKTLVNITPRITCSSSRVNVSPAATVSEMKPGVGVRYKAAVKAWRRVASGHITFTVAFTNGTEEVTAKTFTIKTN